MSTEYNKDRDNIFYYTENIHLVKKSGAKIHINGHTHQNLDYKEDKIRILCNPLGYPGDMLINQVKQIEINKGDI